LLVSRQIKPYEPTLRYAPPFIMELVDVPDSSRHSFKPAGLSGKTPSRLHARPARTGVRVQL